jgi:hypothetical protein
MLFESPGASTVASTATTTPPRSVDGIDNQQVLEFLRLVGELKHVAELLAIEPARAREGGGSRHAAQSRAGA